MKKTLFILLFSVFANAVPLVTSVNSDLGALPEEKPKGSERMGVELGGFGSLVNIGADSGGLRWLYGGNLVMDFQVDKLLIRPLFGYFRKSESMGSVSMAENEFRLGIAGLYRQTFSQGFSFAGGIVNYFDTNYVGFGVNKQESFDVSYRYRVGPMIVAEYIIPGSNLGIEASISSGYSTDGPSGRMFFGVYSGITWNFGSEAALTSAL